MGWFAHDVYGGDGTQSCHYDYLKWTLGLTKKHDDMIGEWLIYKGTKIPIEYIEKFKQNIPKLVKKLPKLKKFWNEDLAMDWQMALSLFLDNNIKPPKIIYDNGITATEFLMEDHARDFDNPVNRRYHLKKFIKRAEKLGYYDEKLEN
jgi:hypothetical protein